MPKGLQGFQKGHTLNVGRKASDETRQLIRTSKLGSKNPMFGVEAWNKNKPHLVGDKNPAWKGDDVGYFALHQWVRKQIPKPAFCKTCNQDKKLEISNNGIYNRDTEQWEWLCRSCHAKKDKRYLNCKMQGKTHSKETRTKMREAWKLRKQHI